MKYRLVLLRDSIISLSETVKLANGHSMVIVLKVVVVMFDATFQTCCTRWF